jgi:hypothetical protein
VNLCVTPFFLPFSDTVDLLAIIDSLMPMRCGLLTIDYLMLMPLLLTLFSISIEAVVARHSYYELDHLYATRIAKSSEHDLIEYNFTLTS